MDTKELRRLLSEATPGEWGTSAEHGHWQIGPSAGGGWAKAMCEIDARSNDNAHNDARLIASLRNSAPALLDVVEAVRAYGGALKAKHDHETANEGEPLWDDPVWEVLTNDEHSTREALDRVAFALADRLAKGGG